MNLPLQQSLVNQRVLTRYTEIPQELNLKPDTNYLFDLSYRSCITVTGASNVEFLQGQLSCDMRKVNQTQIQSGAFCNLQGRILALVDVIDWQELLLILPQDLSLSILSALTKTALFSKVQLQPTHHYKIFGFYLQNPQDHIPFAANLPNKPYAALSHEQYYCYCIAEQLYIFIVRSEKQETDDSPLSHNEWRGSLAWHWLQLHKGRVEIYPESKGKFLPHRLDLQHKGYLSFDKGCYKGQEIIARTHYRATLKHGLKLFIIQTTEPLQAGLKLFQTHAQQEIGELIDYCPLDDHQYLIAVSILFDHPLEAKFENHEYKIHLE